MVAEAPSRHVSVLRFCALALQPAFVSCNPFCCAARLGVLHRDPHHPRSRPADGGPALEGCQQQPLRVQRAEGDVGAGAWQDRDA
jgi:hypothetical protein